MFKRFLSATMAVALAAMVMAPAGALATEIEWGNNGGSSEVTGDSYAVEAVLDVTLPGDLAFGINPLYLDADGDTATTGDNTQIVATDYVIQNYSNVPVLISAKTSVKGGADTKIVTVPAINANTGELSPSAITAKEVYLAMMLPTTAATITDEEAKLTTTAFTLKNAATVSMGGITLDTTAKEVLFRLAKADADGNAVAAGTSGFTFGGAVNPDAVYGTGEEADVTVTTVFTMNTLTSGQYDGGYAVASSGAVQFDGTVVIPTGGSVTFK